MKERSPFSSRESGSRAHVWLKQGGTRSWSFVRLLPADDEGTAFWVVVLSSDLPAHGVADAADAEFFSYVGGELLRRLEALSCFRFAIPGVEPLGAIEFSALEEGVEADERFIDAFRGLVVSREPATKVS